MTSDEAVGRTVREFRGRTTARPQSDRNFDASVRRWSSSGPRSRSRLHLIQQSAGVPDGAPESMTPSSDGRRSVRRRAKWGTPGRAQTVWRTRSAFFGVELELGLTRRRCAACRTISRRWRRRDDLARDCDWRRARLTGTTWPQPPRSHPPFHDSVSGGHRDRRICPAAW